MRGLNVTPSTSPYRAEGDKLFCFARYNDTTGSLSNGMPVVVDVRDAAEFNVYPTTTLATTSAFYNAQSAGSVCLSTTSAGAGSNPRVLGLFAPDTASSLPTKGDIIRVIVMGRWIAQVTTAASATATTVSASLILSTTYATAVAGTAAVGTTIGLVLATGNNDASGAVIQAVPGSGTKTCTVNAFVMPA